MIPKIIHFVWVGDQEKPELVNKCIESWKRYCPEYKIMEWDNDSLKIINNLYVQQAYKYKKWAFVSDYIRLYALYNYGGFYCDSDLEITDKIDKFRKHVFFTGYENYNNNISPLTAFMGAEKNCFLVKDLLDEYENIVFEQNGVLDETTNVRRFADYCKNKYGLNSPYNGNDITILEKDIIIYPYYYFCIPCNGKENYAIHHFNGSWVDSYLRRLKVKIGKYSIVRFKKIFGRKDELPIYYNEKLILCINISRKRKYCLLRIDE